MPASASTCPARVGRARSSGPADCVLFGSLPSVPFSPLERPTSPQIADDFVLKWLLLLQPPFCGSVLCFRAWSSRKHPLATFSRFDLIVGCLCYGAQGSAWWPVWQYLFRIFVRTFLTHVSARCFITIYKTGLKHLERWTVIRPVKRAANRAADSSLIYANDKV